MAYDPHVHPDQRDHYHAAPPQEPTGGFTSYAAVKYGFILLITIVILYFIAKFIIPLFT
jgi:hypothetical protein